MADAIATAVDKLLTAVDRSFAGRYSAVLYGSAARGDYVAGRSDINVLLILDLADPASLRALGSAFDDWKRASREPPLLITRAEWAVAGDAFPIEITDMRLSYRMLRGDDPFGAVTVAPADLRRAVERELRGKLLRLRQGYVTHAAEEKDLGALATHSAPTFLLLFRTLLALQGKAPPREPVELVTEAGTLVGFESGAVVEVVRHRGERAWRCPLATFEAYLAAVERTVRFVDQLQLGDRE